MSHFGSHSWPDKYGVVASFRTSSHIAAVSQTTLYTVLTGEDGWYRISAAGRTRAVGTGTGQTWDLDLEVNNGTAQTTVNFLDAIDALVADDPQNGLVIYFLKADSTIKYTTNVNGTNTDAATLDIAVIVERI